MQELYEQVCTIIQHLDAKQGWDGDIDQRTEIEKRLHPALWEVWEVLKMHPAVETTRPDDSEGFAEVRIPTKEERAQTEADMRQMLRQGLADFLAQSKVKKKDFAAQYGGVQPGHVSNMLAGRRLVNLPSFVSAVERFGWQVSISVTDKKITFKK